MKERYVFVSFIFISFVPSIWRGTYSLVTRNNTMRRRVCVRTHRESVVTLKRKKRKEKNLVYFAINSPSRVETSREPSERAAQCDLCLVPALKVENGEEMRLQPSCATILSRFADFCADLWHGTTAASLPSRQVVEGRRRSRDRDRARHAGDFLDLQAY